MTETRCADAPQFYRRVNPDGTFDGICLICHLTAARAGNEAELRKQEADHHCGRKQHG
jgi:hypothetical protein